MVEAFLVITSRKITRPCAPPELKVLVHYLYFHYSPLWCFAGPSFFRLVSSLYWKCFVELIRKSQANNRRAISYATQKLSATHAYARSLYAIRSVFSSM